MPDARLVPVRGGLWDVVGVSGETETNYETVERKKMKRVFLLTLLFLGPGHAFAQDVAKPNSNEKSVAVVAAKLPDKITLTDETDKLRMIQLRMTAIVNDAQRMRDQLAKFEEQIKREQEDLNAEIIKAIAKHGLKADDLPKYNFQNAAPLDTGPIQLIRKTEDAPKVEPIAAAKKN